MNKEAFDWNKWVSILISGSALEISVLSLMWNVLVERMRRKAELEVLQRVNFYMGGEDEKQKLY